MPFKSYDDLFNAFKQDPKLARHRVKRAEKLGQAVVSPKNPGYEDRESGSPDSKRKAILRRLDSKERPRKASERKVNERLRAAAEKKIVRRYKNTTAQGQRTGQIVTPLEDEIVTKRKKVGY